MKRRDIIFILILGLAIARIALIINPLRDPDRGITVDSDQYLSLAQGILDNQRYQSATSPDIDLFRAPGYSTFLAGILWVTGGSLTAVYLLQYAFGLLSAAMLYILGNIAADERVGIFASTLFLLSPNALFWSATIMTEILFTTGLLLAVLLCFKALKHQLPLWPIGLLLGLLALIRPIGLYLIIIWGIWFLGGNALKVSGFPRLKAIAYFVLVGLVVVTPWFVRNYQKHGEFTLSTVSGTTIRSYHLALSLVEAEGISWEDAKQKVLEMDANESALLKIISSHPVGFIKAQARGIARTILGTEVGTWMKIASEQPYSGSGILNAILSGNLSAIKEAVEEISRSTSASATLLLVWGMLYALLIAILSVIGFIRIMRHGEIGLRSLGILIAVTVLYLLFSPGAAGEARFRVPAEPLLAFTSAMVLLPKPEGDTSGRHTQD